MAVEEITEKTEKVDAIVERVKIILSSLHLTTFHKYREAGKIIVESGYRKGAWRSEHRKNALKEWAISQQNFSNIVQLGEMSDEEFTNVVSNFSSVHAWANRYKRDRPDPVDTPPLPEGRYRCLVIDPPWPMDKSNREARPKQSNFLDYSTMTLKRIEKEIPVAEKAAEDGCHIYLWTTQRFLPNAFDLFKAWDVEYHCLLTWVKPTGMTPFSWMFNTEHVLFGRIGSLDLLKQGVKLSFDAPSREHSRKPDIFYDIVRKVSPSPRLDMFSREKHEGFESWGIETDKFEGVN